MCSVFTFAQYIIPSYGSIECILSNNRQSHLVKWFFHTKKVNQQQKVSTHVSLRGLRRLTGVDTSRRCLKHPFARGWLILIRHRLCCEK